MLQVKNNSPFSPAISLFPNQYGIDTLYVIIKATFTLQSGYSLKIADDQIAPFKEDEFWGDPIDSSLKQASDYHIGKQATDVILLGSAWAPDGLATNRIDVGLMVAEKQKMLAVFGDRFWDNGKITEATAFNSMPLVYELAYGGKYIVPDDAEKILIDERNPVGRGFRGELKDSEVDGLQLPNIEDPNNLIQNMDDVVDPAGFAQIAPSWLPRRNYAGTYDEQWIQKRAPYLPEDFDVRFLNNAHPDWIFDRFLQGGEPVKVHNMCQNGALDFLLPVCRLTNKVKIKGNIEEPPLNLETVVIEPDEERLSLVWRSEIQCDKKTLDVEEVEIDLRELHV